ncbi:MAG TPA: ATPase, T2SS/T4P/T4SS family [Haloplasmataceae bacterium]
MRIERRIKIDYTNLLSTMIIDALKVSSTDIHFLNGKNFCEIKFRIDDSLVPYKNISKKDYERFVLFIKYKSQMNLNISKSPQSSALNLIINDETYRIRVSTLPSYDSESLVLRINQHYFTKKIKDLLYFPQKEELFLESIKYKNGLFLLTGPTCSGKTTLTYSILKELRTQGLSIVSIEDPIEHYESGFVQLQVNENAGVNYTIGVKEILRHDPDIIFIGEIRDEYTAKAAIRASLTGHKVISTMHATNALKALYRLLELGISRFDLEQTLVLVTNQRLMVHENGKKIIFEHLNDKQIYEALELSTNKEKFNYQTIEDYIVDINNYQVMKK